MSHRFQRQPCSTFCKNCPRCAARCSSRVPRAEQPVSPRCGPGRAGAPGAPPAGAARGAPRDGSGPSELETAAAGTACRVKGAGAYRSTYGGRIGCLWSVWGDELLLGGKTFGPSGFLCSLLFLQTIFFYNTPPFRIWDYNAYSCQQNVYFTGFDSELYYTSTLWIFLWCFACWWWFC